MAGSKTQYLSKALLDHALGITTWTPPATVYAVLSDAAFDPTATGAACDETSASGYARVALTNNGTNWPAATSAIPSVKANGTDIVWPTATADWTPLSVYLADASSNGNLLYGADLTIDGGIVPSGETFQIDTGTFVLSED